MTRLFIELTPTNSSGGPKRRLVYARAIVALSEYVAPDGEVFTYVDVHDDTYPVKESVADILKAMDMVDDVQVATIKRQPQPEPAPAPKPDTFESILDDMDDGSIGQDEAEERLAAYFASKKEQIKA